MVVHNKTTMRTAWNKKTLDTEKIIFLYKEKSLRKIAEIFKCDRDVIHRILTENRIKIRTLSEEKLLNPQKYWLGKKRDKETVEKTRAKMLGRVAWNKGKKVPQISGEKNFNWKGGVTDKNQVIRTSLEYKQWRMSVLQRDRFECVMCGYRSKMSYAHGDGKCDIRVDHIKPFSLYPELRLSIENGRTLCVACDKKHGYNYHRDKLR